MLRHRLMLPILALSVVAALGCTVAWWRNQSQVHQLTIATGSEEGEYHAFATALAQVVARHSNIKISVIESQGAQQNLELMEQGKAQLAIIQSDTPPKPSTQAMAFLFPEIFHLVARPDANIQNFSDLRNKRVAVMPEGSGSHRLFWALVEHYNLQQTFTPITYSPNEAYAALKQGQVDALGRVMALGNASIKDLLRSTQSRLVPIDQVEALRLSLPYLEASTIPKGTYDGLTPIPANDLPVVGVRAVLVSHAEVKPEIVKTITQTLFESRNELVALYPQTATVRLPEAMENLGIPLHPGAIEYYAPDRPFLVNFLVDYAESIGLIISLAALGISGLIQFRVWLNTNQKNRADDYNQQIIKLIERIQSLDNLKELETVRIELFQIFQKVVLDLDRDNITAESFHSFTFPWEVAITTLRHQEMVLMNPSTRGENASNLERSLQEQEMKIQ